MRPRPTGLRASPAWTFVGTQGGAQFGSYLASRCDVNGDGRTDVCVSAPNWTDHATHEGAIFAFSEPNTDSDGDGVRDAQDCAPLDPGTSTVTVCRGDEPPRLADSLAAALR